MIDIYTGDEPQAQRLNLNEGGPGGPGGPPPGSGSDFQRIDPKLCTSAGYSVPEYFFREHERDFNDDYEDQGHDGPTLFITEPTEGNFEMIARSESQTGGEEDEVFSGIKLNGFEEEFALVGSSILPESQVKAEAAEGILRNIRFLLDAGDQPPPHVGFTDPACDPANIVNKIITSMGREAYSVDTIFANQGFGPPQHFQNGGGNEKPLCSAVDDGDSALTVDEFCYEDPDDDGIKTLKTQTYQAATSFCQAADKGLKTEYWSNRLADADGNKISGCSEEWNDDYGWNQKWIDESEADCNAHAYEDNKWWVWKEIERSMAKDCSEMRAEGHSLKTCFWSSDYNIEPNYQQPDWDTRPQPDKWWEGHYAINEADAAIDAAKSNIGGGQSDMFFVQEEIDRCVANFDRTAKEVVIRSAEIDAKLTAIEIINTAKNADGTPKYIKETEDKFKKHGDFSFTAAKMASLSAILTKGKAALDGWSNSISRIKGTYALLKKAAVKADAADAQKCVPDEIGTLAKFEAIYDRFDKAYNGVSGDLTDRGLTKWQEAAFNHFQCMSMDEGLRRIDDFGMTAPTQGVKDSNSTESTDSLFLVEECSGYYDHRNRCVEQVACKIPSGAKTYVPISELFDMAVLEEGCEEIEEKVAMMGRVNKSSRSINNVDILSGDITANVMLMTKMPSKDCKVTVSYPALDEDSCYKYANAAGKVWSELTAEELKTAVSADFTLQYDSVEEPLLDLANREIFEMILIPNSETDLLSDDDEGGDDSSVLDQLIE